MNSGKLVGGPYDGMYLSHTESSYQIVYLLDAGKHKVGYYKYANCFWVYEGLETNHSES